MLFRSGIFTLSTLNHLLQINILYQFFACFGKLHLLDETREFHNYKDFVHVEMHFLCNNNISIVIEISATLLQRSFVGLFKELVTVPMCKLIVVIDGEHILQLGNLGFHVSNP